MIELIHNQATRRTRVPREQFPDGVGAVVSADAVYGLRVQSPVYGTGVPMSTTSKSLTWIA
jgi:hypothetical protein